MISVLAVDDQTCAMTGLEQILDVEPDIELLDMVADPDVALEIANHLKPQVLLLELRLAQAARTSYLLESLVRNRPWKTLVYSTEERNVFVNAALEAGAAGFLSKRDSVKQIAAAIRLVARGHRRVLSSNLQAAGDPLPTSMRDIAALLGCGMSYDQIARTRNRSPHTIRKQCDLMQIKLGLQSREQLIAWSVSHGYPDVYAGAPVSQITNVS